MSNIQHLAERVWRRSGGGGRSAVGRTAKAWRSGVGRLRRLPRCTPRGGSRRSPWIDVRTLLKEGDTVRRYGGATEVQKQELNLIARGPPRDETPRWRSSHRCPRTPGGGHHRQRRGLSPFWRGFSGVAPPGYRPDLSSLGEGGRALPWGRGVAA